MIFYREIDDESEDDGGDTDEEQLEDGVELPSESDSEESDDEV